MTELPRGPVDVIRQALAVLERRLTLHEIAGPTTHVALVADELEHAEVSAALGRFIVGVVAGAVDEDTKLSEELLARAPDSRAEVREHILGLIGNDNAFPNEQAVRFRDHVRNPWLAEGIAHALLVLRGQHETLCLEGGVKALKQPHPSPQRQGLDLIGIYEANELPSIAVGEAKASRRYGARQLNDAAAFFKTIDEGYRGVEIRSEVQALKHVLSEELRAGIADGFWRERCSYLPVVVYSEPMGELDDHAALGALRPPVTSRRLVALRVEDFHAFFDAVADGTREAFEEVVGDV
jgi:hypothetical protein